MTFKKGDQDFVGKHFRAAEFDCPCDECEETLIEPELVDKLDHLRELMQTPIRITSGYRCPKHQAALLGIAEKQRKAGDDQALETVKHSTHTRGMAADIKIGQFTGDEIEAHARIAGFKSVGVGLRWAHVDIRGEKVRRWRYNY